MTNLISQHIIESRSSRGRSQEAFFGWLRKQKVDSETIKVFKWHKIDELTFQMLKECDLREMGIDKLGAIKRILYIIENKCLCSYSDSDDSIDHCSSRGSDSKVWKTCISAFYCFLSLGVTSFIMVLAHERLPDISKYPPLPDILLDNLPHIPWAFEAAEMICIFLFFIWMTVLVFHKHRLILFRRCCSLMGTVFLLRSVTMIITSLSVPGKHLLTECKPFVFHSYKERFERAAAIWFGMGVFLLHSFKLCTISFLMICFGVLLIRWWSFAFDFGWIIGAYLNNILSRMRAMRSIPFLSF